LSSIDAPPGSDLLQLLELLLQLPEPPAVLGDASVALLLLHTQLLDDVAVLQLLLGELLPWTHNHRGGKLKGCHTSG